MIIMLFPSLKALLALNALRARNPLSHNMMYTVKIAVSFNYITAAVCSASVAVMLSR